MEPEPNDQEAEDYTRPQYEAPNGKMEELLAEIWAAVLKVDRVGCHDNFFELGGDSRTGMNLLAKVAECLNIRAPVVTVFQYPTIRDMAQLLEQLLAEEMKPSGSDSNELVDGTI